MNFKLNNLWLLLALVTFGNAIAQEQDSPGYSPLTAEDIAGVSVLQWVDAMSPYSGMLAAEDGHYLAQTEEELQTYYDLAMSYEYIDSDPVRTLLQLDPGEGIIIEGAEQDGEGFRVGFRAGDLVLRVGEEPVVTQYELVQALTRQRGNSVGAVVRRGHQLQEMDIQLSPIFLKDRSRWILGVSVEEMSELLNSHLQFDGAVITEITEGGPAQKMGMRVHDIIVKIDETDVTNLENVREAMQASEGETVTVEVVRAGNRMTVEVTPAKDDPDTTSAWVEFSLPTRMATLRGLTFQPETREYVWDLVETAGEAEPEQDSAELKQISGKLETLQEQIRQLSDLVNQR